MDHIPRSPDCMDRTLRTWDPHIRPRTRTDSFRWTRYSSRKRRSGKDIFLHRTSTFVYSTTGMTYCCSDDLKCSVPCDFGTRRRGYHPHSGLVLLGDHGLLILTAPQRFHIDATSLRNTNRKYGGAGEQGSLLLFFLERPALCTAR